MRTRITEAFSSRLPLLAVCLGLIGITWFVFGQTRAFPFIDYDDPAYVYEVPEINHGLTAQGIVWAFTNVPSPNWYPLTNISHMVEAQFYGMNAGGYHLTNVLLHTTAVLLLFLLLWQMTGSIWRSAFGAALFAIHPLRVESVAWVIERKDVLSGVFFMLTLIAYLAYARKPGVIRYVIVVALFACGLMSKPMLVTTPIILLLLDHWPLQRGTDFRVWRRLVLEKIPLLALSAASCAGTFLAETSAMGPLGRVPFLPRLNNAIVSTVTYIRQMFWPADLAVFYPHPHDQLKTGLVMLCAALIIGITLIAVLLRRKHPYVLVGWFWYLVMLSPVVGIVQAGLQGHADRFTYLPQIGLYLLVTCSVADFTLRWTKQREILAVAAGLTVLLSVLASVQ